MKKFTYFKSREENLVVSDLKGETLIYDFSRAKAYCLNETSAFIWNNLNGQRSVSQIAEALAKKTKQPINEEIIWLAIDELKKEGLMAEFEEANSPLKGMSRREAVKRVGLATMIALPFISSLIAPKAAHAASATGGCGSPCDANCRTGGCDRTVNGSYCYDESFRSIPSGQTYCTNQSVFCAEASSKCCSGGTATVVDYTSCQPRETRCRCD